MATRSSQCIAMDLRWYLNAASPGSTYWTYPDGPRSKVLTPYTDAERAEHAAKVAALRQEWKETDPDGAALWEAAERGAANGADTNTDPCRWCWECRSRLGYTE